MPLLKKSANSSVLYFKSSISNTPSDNLLKNLGIPFSNTFPLGLNKATDPPGFTVDQKEEELGQKLLLPDWLEPDRSNLEKVLPKINIPSLDTFSAGLNPGD